MRMQIIEPDGFNIFILVFYLYILFNPVLTYEYVKYRRRGTVPYVLRVCILPKTGKGVRAALT